MFADSIICRRHRPNSSMTILSCTTGGIFILSASSAWARRQAQVASATSEVKKVYGSLSNHKHIKSNKALSNHNLKPTLYRTEFYLNKYLSVCTVLVELEYINCNIIDFVYASLSLDVTCFFFNSFKKNLLKKNLQHFQM